MGYCTIVECDLVLAQALTSARPDTPGERFKLWEIGHVRDSNRIPDEVVDYYISLGDNQIDGILSQQYYTPLRKCVLGQWDLDANIDEYNQYVETSEENTLVPGDRICIFNTTTGESENHIVAAIIDEHTVSVVSPITTTFLVSDNVVVKRIQYPPPINQVSARYAAAFIYDKYFAAQNAPDVSDYGNTMRDVAMGQLNDILNGKVILKNQIWIGDRFGNAYLCDSYAHRDRGYASSERNMSKLT